LGSVYTPGRGERGERGRGDGKRTALGVQVAHGWAGYNIDYEPGGMWSAPEFASFLADLQVLTPARATPLTPAHSHQLV
jgi:hypothetical protein